ncbi:spore protease YyaC [Paenibacillus sp. YYML68]|uniref:spore protease YyaC n=1 Tax=Paenibacillus sp. YYML68 TaxID=2909250 RepID=UPI00248FD4AC|nr:spore protease YyaC [Paenibacillus sp. YYML68]
MIWGDSNAAGPLLRKKVKADELHSFMELMQKQGAKAEELVFICIGTDRSTGDSLGPIVGTMLQEAGYTGVIGTLEHPLDASNMHARLIEIPPGSVALAIDACLGQASSVGWYQVSNRPLAPGKSVGKQLPLLGTYSIAAIVNVDQGQKYSILQSTSLYKVMMMAKEITTAIRMAFPLTPQSDSKPSARPHSGGRSEGDTR